MATAENTLQRLKRISSTKARDAAAFNKALDEYANNLPAAHIAKLQVALALQLIRKIVMRTPVGNPSLWKTPPAAGYVGGRARANWQVSVSSSMPKRSLKKKDKSGGETIQTRTNQILRHQIGNPIFIVNNLSYVPFLEDGSSTQAPVGMLSVSLAEVKEQFS